MINFVNRQRELSSLKAQYNEKSSFVVVYGRRRVGKTALIKEFIKDKQALYFLASQENETDALRRFGNALSEFSGLEYLSHATFNRWNDLFAVFAQAYPNERKILVIDELPYIVSVNAAFPSILQWAWDSLFAQNNVMLILCGSLINMMEKYALNYNSPLYGRRTGQIKLKQIDFSHYGEFYKGMPYRDQIEHFAVTGGVPKYIQMFSGKENLFDEIKRLMLNPEGMLYEEPEFLLRAEVDDVNNYFSIIKSIAAGNHKSVKIGTDIGIKQTSLPKYLKTLIDLDILEREVPVTEENPEKSKMGLYYIKDNYLRFWFRFVYPERSRIEMGNSDNVLAKIKQNFIDSHVAYVYEKVCFTTLWDMAELGRLRFNKIGRWWSNKEEIDIVALDSMGNDIVFCECKYRSQKMDADIFFELLRKKEYVSWNLKNRNEKFVLFSISGFTDQLKALALSRDDLILADGK